MPLPAYVASSARSVSEVTGGTLSFMFLGADLAGVRCSARRHECLPAVRGQGVRSPPTPSCCDRFAGRSAGQVSTMILPQVHLRKPCYDFSFL
jgi:hypothetical protein